MGLLDMVDQLLEVRDLLAQCGLPGRGVGAANPAGLSVRTRIGNASAEVVIAVLSDRDRAGRALFSGRPWITARFTEAETEAETWADPQLRVTVVQR